MAFRNLSLPESCSRNIGGRIRLPLKAKTLTPYVKVFFPALNVTVGNESCPELNNSSVIKSFKFGVESTFVMEVEIVDTTGYSFSNVYNQLCSLGCDVEEGSQCASNFGARVRWDFGWIYEDNFGNIGLQTCAFNGQRKQLPDTPKFDNYHYGIIQSINCDTQGSTFVYNIKVAGTDGPLITNRADETYGSDSQKVRLRYALESVVQNVCGGNKSVAFSVARKDRDGNFSPANFYKGDSNLGPYGVWSAEQQSALGAARKWVNSQMSDREKGFTFIQNSTEIPTIVLYEDPVGERNLTNGDAEEVNLGTYIINGGDMSPVISFEPEIPFQTYSLGSGGGIGTGSSKPEVLRQPKKRGLGKNRGPQQGGVATKIANGMQVVLTAPQSDLHNTSPEKLMEEFARAIEANATAAVSEEQNLQLQATMTIQGDPVTYGFPVDVLNNKVSIIYMNPFSLNKNFNSTNGSDLEWLAAPQCNPYLSGKDFLITKVDHEISGGKFVTKLKIGFNIKNEIPPAASLSQ